jgi:hypothetical protein
LAEAGGSGPIAGAERKRSQPVSGAAEACRRGTEGEARSESQEDAWVAVNLVSRRLFWRRERDSSGYKNVQSSLPPQQDPGEVVLVTHAHE